jgi:ADP-heptose:LPS heptosyltransferase
MLADQFNFPILVTGSEAEKKIADVIAELAGAKVFSLAGHFTLEEFIALIRQSSLVVSVNTATVHIASAMKTPVVVLYAQTNPQHTPWKTSSRVIYFPVKEELKSKNEIINFVNDHYFKPIDFPTPAEVVSAAVELLSKTEVNHGGLGSTGFTDLGRSSSR